MLIFFLLFFSLFKICSSYTNRFINVHHAIHTSQDEHRLLELHKYSLTDNKIVQLIYFK